MALSSLNKNILFYSLFFMLVLPTALHAQAKGLYPGIETKWAFPLRGGLAYQFDANLDDGGSFNVNRLFIQGGPTYSLEPGRSISFAVGYGYDGYDFAGAPSLATGTPWDDIHSLRFSVPVRWKMDSTWSVMAVPVLRFTAENGADLDRAATGGGFAGFTYRFNDSLTIGPGIGVLSQLEESASVFPILIIRWKITDQISLRTGGGLAATQGPGLSLNWQPSSRWDFMLGGRYEKLRFRLDKDSSTPSGIGENTSFPLVIGATYNFDSKNRVSIIGGLDMGGELRLEDEGGKLVRKDRYETTAFLGLTFYFRF